MTEKLVAVQTFWNAGEAHLAKLRLEGESILAFLENENIVITAPYLANSPGIKLNVKQSDVEAALKILAPHEQNESVE